MVICSILLYKWVFLFKGMYCINKGSNRINTLRLPRYKFIYLQYTDSRYFKSRDQLLQWYHFKQYIISVLLSKGLNHIKTHSDYRYISSIPVINTSRQGLNQIKQYFILYVFLLKGIYCIDNSSDLTHIFYQKRLKIRVYHCKHRQEGT